MGVLKLMPGNGQREVLKNGRVVGRLVLKNGKWIFRYKKKPLQDGLEEIEGFLDELNGGRFAKAS